EGGADTTKTIVQVADNIVATATDAFSKVPDALADMTDMEPVITPVLDLSKVEAEAKKIGDITKVTPITAAASYGQATAISEEHQESQMAQAETVSSGVEFNFEQNNYSPESLSDIEIYRQTRNQLAQIKSALELVPS